MLFSSSSQTTESLATEVQRTFVSKSFLREERKHVEDMKQNFTMEGFEKAAEFYTNIMHIMKFIDKFAGPNISSNDGDVSKNLYTSDSRLLIGNYMQYTAGYGQYRTYATPLLCLRMCITKGYCLGPHQLSYINRTHYD